MQNMSFQCEVSAPTRQSYRLALKDRNNYHKGSLLGRSNNPDIEK